MRTTVDLPEDVHRLALSLARSRHETLSQTVSDLLQRALLPGGRPEVSVDPETGLPRVSVGRTITSDDVADADDDV